MKMKDKIKIIIIQSRICVGGPAVHTGILMKYLDPERFQPILIGGALQTSEMSRVNELKNKGLSVIIIDEMGRDISLWRDIKSVFKLYRIIKRERPLIVDTHTAKAGAIGRIAAFLAGVPIIIHTFHGHVFHDYFGKIKTDLFIILERLLARISTCIIVISPNQKFDIVEKYKIVIPEKVVLIRYGFELERFLYLKKNHQLKQELSLNEHDFLIGIVGRLVPIKNHEMILQVLLQLHRQAIKAHLCIVGDGELRQKLISSVKEKKITKYVHFLGWRLDIKTIYAGIDVLALTSLNEGTPFTIIEAMASQIPVIATSVGGVTNLINDGKTGFLCDVNNTTEMREKIKQLWLDSNLKQEIIQNAQKAVAQTYHYSRLIYEIETLYKNLIRAKGLPYYI